MAQKLPHTSSTVFKEVPASSARLPRHTPSACSCSTASRPTLPWSSWSVAVLSMSRAPWTDDVWRDYCVQFLGKCYPAVADMDSRRSMADALWEALETRRASSCALLQVCAVLGDAAALPDARALASPSPGFGRRRTPNREKHLGLSPKSATSGYCSASAPDNIHRQKE